MSLVKRFAFLLFSRRHHITSHVQVIHGRNKYYVWRTNSDLAWLLEIQDVIGNWDGTTSFVPPYLSSHEVTHTHSMRQRFEKGEQKQRAREKRPPPEKWWLITAALITNFTPASEIKQDSYSFLRGYSALKYTHTLTHTRKDDVIWQFVFKCIVTLCWKRVLLLNYCVGHVTKHVQFASLTSVYQWKLNLDFIWKTSSTASFGSTQTAITASLTVTLQSIIISH